MHDRLFIGSSMPIRLQTIILMQSQKNYQRFINSLCFFDFITSEERSDEMYFFDGMTSTRKISSHIEHLLDYKLGKAIDKTMDSYVYEMFDAYCKNKKNIDICLRRAGRAQHFSNLLMHSYEYDKDVYLRKDTDKTNIIRPVLSKIFRNAVKVQINASNCSFSLIGFLDVLKTSNWQRVEIGGEWVEELAQSFIWEWERIKKQYESNNYKIKFEAHCGTHVHVHHPWLKIKKLTVP